LTSIRAANRFSYFAAAAATSWISTHSGGWHDQDLSPGITLAPSKEVEVEEGETMLGCFEPVHRELSLPWTEVLGNNLDDFLTLLSVK